MGGREFYTSYSDMVSYHVYYWSFFLGYRAFWSPHGSSVSGSIHIIFMSGVLE